MEINRIPLFAKITDDQFQHLIMVFSSMKWQMYQTWHSCYYTCSMLCSQRKHWRRIAFCCPL